MSRIDERQFSIDDLEDLDLVKKDGRPTENMTDKIWQPFYELLQEKNIPFIDGQNKRMKCKYIKAVVDENGEYLPDETTVYQRYCMFINSALREIRMGKVAYVFYLHQVSILLRFHPDLKTRFKDYYWEVWLDNANG